MPEKNSTYIATHSCLLVLRKQLTQSDNGPVPRLPSFLRRSQRPGVLLLEAALGTGLLVLFLGALGVTIYRGQDTTKAGGDRIRAAKLAQQTIEGARDIGTRHFNDGPGSLTNAIGSPQGVVLNSETGLWQFSGTKTVDGLFSTSLTVTKPDANDPDTLDLAATTTWSSPAPRAQSLTIKARFTNWRQQKNVGDWGSTLQLLGRYNGGSQQFSDVAVVGTTAYITNGAPANNVLIANLQGLDATPTTPITSPGVIDMSGQTPVAIASRGTTLYVLTHNGVNSEIRVYDGSFNPFAPAFVTSVVMPLTTGMQATSLAISGDFLYVGAK